MHLASASITTVAGTLMRCEKEFYQRIFILVTAQNHMAATTAIAAIRSAFRHKLFAPET
jgi:hypothetical protein